METIVPLAAIAILSLPPALLAGYFVTRGPSAMTALFRSDPGLGWPRGVQEEDPPTGWTWRLPPGGRSESEADRLAVVDDPLERPVARPLAARIGRGTSRRSSRW